MTTVPPASPPEASQEAAGAKVRAETAPAFKLQPGALVEARVVRELPQGKLQVDILGTTHTASLKPAAPEAAGTALPRVAPGDTAVFRVVGTHPELELERVESRGLAESAGGRPSPAAPGEPLARGTLLQARVLALSPEAELPSKTSPGGYRAVVDLDGKPVQVWLDRPVAPGKSAAFKIVRTAPHLLLSPSQDSGESPSEKGTGLPGVFAKGSRIFARVVSLDTAPPGARSGIPPGAVRAQIEVAGQMVDVLLDRASSPGESGMFRVLEAGARPLLSLVSEGSQGLDQLPQAFQNILGARVSVSQIYEALIRSLAELSASKPSSEVNASIHEVLGRLRTLVYDESQVGRADFFRRFIASTGFLTESAGAKGEAAAQEPDTLKSLLLDLERVLDQQAGADKQDSEVRTAAAAVRESAGQALQHLLANQILNTVAYPSERTLFFEIPLAWAGLMETGRLWVQFKQEDEAGAHEQEQRSSEIMIVFLLNLENLGPIRVDALLSANDRISVTVLAEQSEVVSYIRGQLHELGGNLEAGALKVDRISCLQAHRERIQAEDGLSAGLSILEEGQLHIVA